MMDKRATVIESIQKLIALGVSDKEISDNLFDVGIDQKEAMQLIEDARKSLESKAPDLKSSAGGAAPVVKKPSEPEKPEFEGTDVPMDEQIVKQIPIPKKTSEAGLTVKSSAEKQAKPDVDIADKIMKDVADQSGDGSDDGEEFEEEVEKTLEGGVAGGKDSEKDAGALPADALKSLQKNYSPPAQKDAQKASAKIEPQKAPVQKDASAPVVQKEPVVSQKPQNLAQSVSPSKASKDVVVPKMDFDAASKLAGAKSVDDFSSFKLSPQTAKDLEASPDFEELWKKGIVVAVNAKLAEMKRLKEDVDSEVQERVDEAVRKELYQFKVLMDSQKELIQSSNKEALEQKQREIVFIIDAKIAEIKQYNKQLAENLAAIEAAKRQQEASIAQISLALEEVRKTKAQIVVEMNSELIKSKSSAQAFIDSASAHMSQMDERINKTLELEKNIAEGMLNQAEQRIEQLTVQRADELIAQLQVELNRLQAVSKKISPESLEQKIMVLDEFRKQFLTGMQQSLTQINAAIDELNLKNAAAERALEEKTLVIDAKIEELTKFEKELTDRLEKKAVK